MTGAGKSTLASFLTGNGNLTAVLTDIGMIIVDEDGTIGNSTISQTFVPNLFLDETCSAFYDCAGFSDNRNETLEIVTSFFNKRVADHSEKAKLIVVASHSYFVGTDRTALVALIKAVAQFVQSEQIISSGLSLIATNAWSPGNDTTLLGYMNVHLQRILENNATHFGEEPPPVRNRAIAILIALTETSNGTSKKLGLFRTPDSEGLLDDMEEFQIAKIALKNLVSHRTEYTKRPENAFAYTLSDGAKLLLLEFAPLVYQNVIAAVSKITNDISQNIFSFLNNLKTIKQKTDEVENTKIKSVDLLNVIGGLLENPSEKLRDFLVETNASIAQHFPQYISAAFDEELKKQLAYVYLTDELKTDWSAENTWLDPFKELSANIEAELRWYKFMSQLFNELTEVKIQIDNQWDLKGWWNDNKDVTLSKLQAFWANFYGTNAVMAREIEEYYAYAETRPQRIAMLNQVLGSTLENLPSCARGADTCICEGKYLPISATSDCFKGFSPQEIVVLGHHSIIFDVDAEMIEPKEYNMFLMSPNWILKDSSRIVNLNGAPGPSPQPPKVAGHGTTPGIPGKSGKNAGNLFGITNLEPAGLSITAIGGKGGAGQQGQDGLEPAKQSYKTFRTQSGEPTLIVESECAAWSGEIKVYVLPHKCEGYLNPPFRCPADDNGAFVELYGNTGSPGGVGGNGGCGGTGGRGGIVKVIRFEEQERNFNGSAGPEGNGGSGGIGSQGGLQGDTSQMYIDDRTNGKRECKIVSSISRFTSTERGTRGANGGDGINCSNKPVPGPNNFNPADFFRYIPQFISSAQNLIGNPFFHELIATFLENISENDFLP